MRSPKTCIFWLPVVLGFGLSMGLREAAAQGDGRSGGLGGFGAASSAGMTGDGPMLIPYGGTFEGFMPGRMGGGSSLSFRTRPADPTGIRRTPFRLSPIPGGQSGMSGRSAGAGRMGPLAPRGTMGFGGGAPLGGMRRMPGRVGSSVMPPSIGYPFRQPPSLLANPSAVAGMSM